MIKIRWINKVAILLLLFLTACSISNKKIKNIEHYKQAKALSHFWELNSKNNKKYVGHYKIGPPYLVKNKKYYPKKYNHYSEVGTASWYACEYHLKYCYTANRDIFDSTMLTGAHRTLPLPSIVKVTNLENKKSLIVMINDRGPYPSDKGPYPPNQNRVIDLSERAATLLGFKIQGTKKVRVQYMKAETTKLYKKLSLQPKENKYATQNCFKPKCTLKQYLNMLNIKYHCLTPRETQMTFKQSCLQL